MIVVHPYMVLKLIYELNDIWAEVLWKRISKTTSEVQVFQVCLKMKNASLFQAYGFIMVLIGHGEPLLNSSLSSWFKGEDHGVFEICQPMSIFTVFSVGRIR